MSKMDILQFQKSHYFNPKYHFNFNFCHPQNDNSLNKGDIFLINIFLKK